jgi:hypothetical protein
MCAVTRRTQRRWRTIHSMHVNDHRFDGDQGEAERYDASCQPMQQGLRQEDILQRWPTRSRSSRRAFAW